MQDPKPHPSSMPPALAQAFKSFVLSHTGIHIQAHQEHGFEETVRAACARFGCASASDYLALLQSAGAGAALEFLVAGITVGESYFFRDPVQIAYLRDEWIPEVCARKRADGSRCLRIWSAGCSNGQELYTLAMLLKQSLADVGDWKLHLLGTDINVAALARCQRGHYSNWSMRTTPDSVRERYFRKDGADYVIDSTLRDMTRFTYLNLVADNFPSVLGDTQSMDLILCRNVFIYFEHDVIRQVMGKFRDCLAADGRLMLAASDPVIRDIPGLACRESGAILSYHLQTDASPAPVAPETRPAAVTARRPALRRPTLATNRTPAENDSALFSLLREHNWGAAEQEADTRLAKRASDNVALRTRATARANLGKLESAAADCVAALAIDATDKHAHFLHALILIELNRMEEAGKALRKVLFLDSGFLEAHHQLGLLLLRAGQRKAGIKSLRNALSLAENGDPQRILHASADMNYARVAEILRQEISMHEGT